MATQARERMLATAEDLFYREGIRAVGIDRVLAVSGVGKGSLYRHFAGKDELVIAVLRRRDQEWREWLAETVTARNLPAAARPLAVFDALAERFTRGDFRGCAFINTMVETADRDSPVHAVAVEHKNRVIDYLQTLLEEAGHPGGRELAEELSLLIDGAIVMAVRDGRPTAAHRAKVIAGHLLDATVRKQPSA
jgi:AcrR family transcriptional regulator